MTQIESHILQRCLEGDKTAFRWVVQTYQRMVFSLALKMLADEEDAKDVAQETFIRVWQGMSGYNPQMTFSNWLYTIASHLCLDRLKNEKRKHSFPQDELSLRQFASDSDSQVALENKDWISIIRLLAERLSPKQRLVFTLCQLEGLTSAEAEQITGMNAFQVKTNLYLARQKIRKRLKALGYD